MGKWTDKNYITRSEWSLEFGGGVSAMKNKKPPVKYQKISFNLCSLTLQPFIHPVCTLDGSVFELENILPFIQKFNKHPITGKELKPSDLIRLTYHCNGSGSYYCPITLKSFTDYTHIVANRKSGNVYSYDAHLTVNQPTSAEWVDPVNGERMQRSDLVVLQDPTAELKNMSDFYYVANKLNTSTAKNELQVNNIKNVNSSTEKLVTCKSTTVILPKNEDKKSAKKEKEPKLPSAFDYY